MHHVTYLFFRMELLYSHCFFEWFKHMEIAWGKPGMVDEEDTQNAGLWLLQLLCLTWTRSIFHWSHTICELPTPFVDLLLWQTCITVLNLHSSMNFNRFHTFTTQKPNNRMLFFPAASLKRGSHLYTDTLTLFVYLHYAATYRPFCTLFAARLPTYRIMARNFDFLLQI